MVSSGSDPQGLCDYRGVFLMEFVWMFMTFIINRRLIGTISFHAVIHRFWALLRYGYSLPQVQNTPEVNSHEGGGPVRNLSTPAQGILRLGQGQMSGNTRGIHIDTAVLPPPTHILIQADDGGLIRRLLWSGV